MDRKIEKKKWSPKKVAQLGAVAVFGLFLIYMFVFRSGGSSLNVKKDRITLSIVKEGPFKEFIPVIGNVLPHTTIYLDAVLGGRVETIYLEAGSKVNKGDKILKLSNTNLMMNMLNNEAQVNRASNDLRATRLQLERNRLDLRQQRVEADYAVGLMEREFKRKEALYKEEMISRKEYEDSRDEFKYLKKKRELAMESQKKDLLFSEQQVKALDSSLNKMEANLNLLKEQLENLTVRAPISGQLTSLIVEVGQSKNPGERLGQIDEIQGFKVRAEIDEHYINRIEIGRLGQFDLGGAGYSLEVKKIFPEVKEGKFEVDLEFKGNTPEGIKRGQTLHIRLQLSEASQAVLLSRGGFYQTTGGNWAFVLDDSGETAVKRRIRLGRQNPDFFEVLEGLLPGDQVITSSYEDFGNMETLILK